MQDKTEQQLIQESLSGDTYAFGEIINRYKDALYRHCFAILRDEAQAEDAAEEAFIAAFYSLHTYDKTRKLSTWLFKIATNKSLDALKKHKHEQPLDDDITEKIAGTHIQPHAQAEYTELHAAVNSLRPEYRSVISLHYWQGMPYEDIATIMQKPQGTIKVWLMRAKDELRKELV